MNPTTNKSAVAEPKQVTTYHEKKGGTTLYRITSIYKGEIDFAKTLEDLVVKKVLNENTAIQLS